MTTKGVELIAAERKRQVEEKEYDTRHDKQHEEGVLSQLAAYYALPNTVICGEVAIGPGAIYLGKLDVAGVHSELARTFKDGKRTAFFFDAALSEHEDRIKDLTVAGALIAAEIDRLQHAAGKQQ